MTSPAAFFPLSPAQREIWLGQLQFSHSPVFTIGECLEMAGAVDDDRFGQALRRLVAETEALRIQVDPGQPRFRIAAAIDFEVASRDFRGAGGGLTAARAWVLEEASQPFAFDGRPLFRFALLRVEETRTLFCYCFHHLVIDGLGAILLMERLAELYSALVGSQEPGPAGFTAYAEKLAFDAAYQPESDACRQDRAYWMERLASPPPMASLAKDPRAPADFRPGLRSSLTLPRAAVDALCAGGASLTQVLLATLAVYLRQQTGAADVVLGMAVGARPGRAMRKLPGLFSNVVPLRLAVPLGGTFAEVCAEAGREVRAALRHQRFRIEDLERELVPGERAPLRRASINVIPARAALDFGGVRATPHDLSNDPTEEFLVTAFDFAPDLPLGVDLVGHPDLFTPEELLAHHGRFMRLLESLAQSGAAETPLSEDPPGVATWPGLPGGRLVSPPAGELALKYWKHAALWTSQPLSLAQQAVWRQQRDAKPSARPRVLIVLRYEGGLELNRLETALEAVLARHPALRLEVFEEQGRTRQRIAAEGRVALAWEQRPDSLAISAVEAAEELAGAAGPRESPWLCGRVVRADRTRGRLMLALHPIAGDAAAAFRLLDEIASGWSAAPLAAPTAAALDWLENEGTTRAAREYWQTTLAGAAPLKLSWRRPAPGERGGVGSVALTRLPAPLVKALEEFAAQHGVAAREVLLAVLVSLLARYSGQRDLVVGATLGERDGDAAPSIGPRSRVWPLRFQVQGNDSLATLVMRVHQIAAHVTTHGGIALDELKSMLAMPASAAFGVVFNHIAATRDAWSFGAAAATLEHFADAPAFAEVALNVVATPGQFAVSLDYDPSLLTESAARRFVAHFTAHLTACLENPDGGLRQLAVSDAGERRQVLEGWNLPASPRPVAGTFPELFRRQVIATPEAIAVEDATRAWTYRELDAWSSRLARRLRARGAQPEKIVGILLENSLENVATIVAVSKSGSAYLPLDPANPATRLSYMLADAGAALVVTREGLREPWGAAAAAWLCIDAPAEEDTAGAEGAGVETQLEPDHLGYVIYTSGTTGNPKGVMVSHANWTQEIRWVAANLAYGPDARVLQFSSPGFDVSAEEIGATLISGGRLFCASRVEMFPGPTLVRLLEERAITHLTLSPSALEACPVAELPTLRKIILGGEACPPELARRWARGERLVNGYGPTETTIIATCDQPLRPDPVVTIGRPIDHYRVYVLDTHGQPAPLGVPGELFIGGVGVTRGYLRRAGLTAERFSPDPFSGEPGARLYRTGDVVRQLDDGRLEFCGRVDEQVKIRGFRIELGEIAAWLRQQVGVTQAVIAVRQDAAIGAQIVAYVTGELSAGEGEALRDAAARSLPAYMVPAQIVKADKIPLTANGKADLAALARLALKTPVPAANAAPLRAKPAAAAAAPLENVIAAVWKDVLGRDTVPTATNFFELGGNSLLLVKVQSRLGEELAGEIPILDLFKYPTIRALAAHLGPRFGGGLAATPPTPPSPPATEAEAATVVATAPGAARSEITDAAAHGIAIVGMAGRFPGARNVDEFWRNLCAGREGITHFDEARLRAAGVAEALLRDPRYVKASGAINDVENFDAGFFGFSPREAALMDPQHRLFLETAWEALEHAGCDPDRHAGAIGVYAGAGMNTYRAQLGGRELLQSGDAYLISLGNDKDFIPTRASYKLNLRGPSLNVNTACSSSLVAVHLACAGLRGGECDLALAGGVSVLAEQTSGYVFRENGIFSPDGHCRPFSSEARGTVPASGVGVVVLKRLADALRDGDTIHAVIQGSAVNNDGAVKVGYTAPSVAGQVEVVRRALRAAAVGADEIGYVEAHGTATELGDPIEIEALTKAFAQDTSRRGFCGIGSVKSNLGHVDAAAGVASLIKVALALKHEQVPASLHGAAPNPAIEFAHTPFYVNHEHRTWARSERVRYAGVSSFGIGGTNAHVIVREPPVARTAAAGAPRAQLLLFSARNAVALGAQAANLRGFFVETPAADLPAVAFTLARGRKAWAARRFVVAKSAAEAAEKIAADAPSGEQRASAESREPPVAFLLPGQGSQYAGMAAGVYAEHRVFREWVDRCAEKLRTDLGGDLREVLFAESGTAGGRSIHDTVWAQPALFVVEYALAQLWLSWGVKPAALIGHSVGEIAAACIAGVFALDDALAFIARRGRLLQAQPAGAMCAVPLAPDEIAAAAGPGVELAAHNGAERCVVAGEFEAISAFEARMAERGVRTMRLHTSHAFHSALVAPAVVPLVAMAAGFKLQAPKIPVISNETGTWLTAEQATDPAYWGRHLRQTVRFHDGLTHLLREGVQGSVLIEVGPGRTLRSLAERHPDKARGVAFVASLPAEKDPETDAASLLAAVGRLWVQGGAVDWDAFYADRPAGRVPLPTYPFQRERHWIEPAPVVSAATGDFRGSGAVASTTLVAPPVTGIDPHASETEVAVTRLWRELLGAEQIGLRESFFALGGDSLIGVQLLARLREVFGVQLGLENLFENPTVEGLAALVEKAVLAEIEALDEAGPAT